MIYVSWSGVGRTIGSSKGRVTCLPHNLEFMTDDTWIIIRYCGHVCDFSGTSVRCCNCDKSNRMERCGICKENHDTTR